MSDKFNYPFNPINWPAKPHDFSGNGLGLYTQETTQRYIPGTRHITWDGRVFKYGKCGATLESMKYFVYNCSQLVAEISDPDAEVNATPAGSTTLTLTVVGGEIGSGRNGIITEDELAGGYISIYTSSSDRPQRMIVGNDNLVAADTTLVLYLDAPITGAISANTNSEICANPYIDLRKGYGGWTAAMGVPCIKATTGFFFWIQTWGICRVSPTSAENHGYGNNHGQFFSDNYGLYQQGDTYVNSKVNLQQVGFRTERVANTTGDAAPFIMLQISI